MDWPLRHEPLWIQITVSVVSVICALIAGGLITKAIRKLSRRVTEHSAGRAHADEKVRSARRLLLIAVPLVMIDVAAFVIGTMDGSVAFARSWLGWTDWREYNVWGTLDAATLGFSLLALRAKLRGKSPRLPMRVVVLSAGMSMAVQLIEGGDEHTWAGGGYLGYLAVVMAMILHVVIDQMMGGEEAEANRKRPRFGMRWLLATLSTFQAWRAWIIYPDDTLKATVANALDHVKAIHSAAAEHRRNDTAPLNLPARWWAAPWKTARRIAVAAQTAADESARFREQIGALDTELTSVREQAERREQAEQNLRAQFAAELLAAEQAARADGEQKARADGEQSLRLLREQVAELVEQLASQSARRNERPATRAKSQAPTVLVQDEQIVGRLRAQFVRQAELIGRPPSRYWVEQNAPCASRQADRVLSALTNWWTEQANGTAREQSGAPDKTGSEQTDDSEREPVAVNG